MKHSINVSVLLLVTSLIAQPLFAESEAERCGRPSCKPVSCREKEKEHCKSFINITEHDINKASRHSTAGLVLDHPGNYRLCENVNWKVNTPASFAITISADNVTLDLDGHFIKQIDTTQAGNFAINITGDAENTLVHNGILQQISGGGILVDAGANCLTIDTIECNHCCYNGQTIVIPPVPGLNGSAAAFLFNGSPENMIENVIITHCKFCDNGIIGTAPVWFTGTITGGTTLTLEEAPLYPVTPGSVLSGAGVTPGTTIVSQTSPTVFTITPSTNVGPEPMQVIDPNGAFIPFGNISWVYMAFTERATIDKCIGNGNFGYLFSFALFFVKSSFLNLSNLVINNPSTFVLSKGMEFFACHNAIVEDTDITNLVMNFTPDANIFPFGHGAEGIKCGSSTDCVFRRITFSGNRVQTQVPTAFAAPTAYADCCGIFYDVISGQGPIRNIVVEDCTAVDMINDGGKSLGNTAYTAGFNNSSAILFAPPIVEAMNNLQYSRCSASGLTAQLGWAYGFGSTPEPNFLAIENDISYTDCTAEDITVTDSAIYAAGFALIAERNIVRNCTANRIIDERPSPAAFGVILDDLTGGQEARSCIVAGNTITNCSTTGIFDNSGNSTNIVNSNYAALNGPGGVGPNYTGLAASSAALIQDWPLAGVPAAPPMGGPVLANVSVHN